MKRIRKQSALPALRIRTRYLVGAIATLMIAATLGLVSATGASAAAPPAPYVNSFENPGDAITGVTSDTQAMFDVTRVPSGTGGIAASSGNYYAEAASNDYYTGTLSQFTRLGGYSSTFPVGGFTTSVAVYLDTSQDAVLGTDLRFDWSSSISDSSGGFLRDFIFNVGTDPTTTGQFIMSASNNAPGWPSNPGRNPLTINTSGWYTLQSRFYDSSGVLAVDMSVLDSTGATLKTWTLSSSSDTIGTVGGNRYGWLVDNGFSSLALDNINRSGTSLGACPVSITGTNPVVYTLLANCTTDQTITVPQNAGGSVFDGNGFSITGIDPTGGHFLGAVVQAATGPKAITVENLTVTVSDLSDSCDAGAGRLAGIRFDGVSGAIRNNIVTDIEQGLNGQSGCQEGYGIDVRNTENGVQPNVSVTGNTVTDYQKNGILATESVAATIKNNVVTGDGMINYIAQNGIQVSFGATAVVKMNSASGNWYTPPAYVACGFLLYQAAGVNASSNNFFNNERNQCNFGKGGGQFSPNP